MPPERFPPDDPRAWIRRARSNLLLAQAPPPGVDLEDLCFNAQQAAEKAIKAVFIARGIAFPYIHDLVRLRALLGRADERVPCTPEDAVELTLFAGRSRYPSDDEPVTEEEYRRAVAIAEAVVWWAEGRVAAVRGRVDASGPGRDERGRMRRWSWSWSWSWSILGDARTLCCRSTSRMHRWFGWGRLGAAGGGDVHYARPWGGGGEGVGLRWAGRAARPGGETGVGGVGREAWSALHALVPSLAVETIETGDKVAV